MKIVNDFNIKKQADRLGVSTWQAPSFLFLLMGLIIIVVMTAVYFVSRNYNSPEIVVLSETIVVIILFIIGNLIIVNVERLAEANQMKTEFISIASHQLKTPLSALNWSTELLITKYREGLNEKQLSTIKEIASAKTKMTRLVNDLLDVARIDQGNLFLAEDNIDIPTLIEIIVEENKVLAKSLGVEVDIKGQNNPPSIIGDNRRIKVAIDNLVSNAIKYSKQGGKVQIKSKKEGKNIQVCIKDNGIGIPEDQQDKLFEKFFRSENARKLSTEGTGLGLYITKNIIEGSGGEIWLESNENKGSSFYFSLPIKSNKIIKHKA